MARKPFGYEAAKEILEGPIQATIEKMSGTEFSQTSEFSEHELIEYNSRMRVFGLEKFNEPCKLSLINYYESEEAKKQQNSLGAIIVFIEEFSVEKALKNFGFQGIKEDADEVIEEAFNDLCKTCAESLKGELSNRGYVGLVMSEPKMYKNDIPEGIEFCWDENKYYDIAFYFWKQKAVVVTLTMGSNNK
ncbi:MAG: hypothetical protein P9X22_00710 [Candidatus Zapsychrus exili]|nr:hypothetical protein [Candidatus Zapsychrus exili]